VTVAAGRQHCSHGVELVQVDADGARCMKGKFHRRLSDGPGFEGVTGRAQVAPALTAPSPPAVNGTAAHGPLIMHAVDLAAMHFPDPKVIVPRLLVEGGVILAAPGKSGKSRLMMSVAVAVASGGMALGSIAVEAGDVLYLALEDGKRRARARMLAAAGNHPPALLDIAVTWPKLDAGGCALLEAWLQTHPSARLVVIDTFKRVKPQADPRRNLYDVDYEAAAPLNDLAIRFGVCIAVVAHTNKIKATDDPTDKISGSTGLLAAMDGTIILERVRGKADAVLGVYHRDLEDARYAIKHDRDIGWRWLGDAAEYARTAIQDEIISAIVDAGRPLPPSEVATVLDRDRNLVRQRMWQMARPNAALVQLLAVVNGRYWPASHALPDGGSGGDA
jgi:hypothetical protein